MVVLSIKQIEKAKNAIQDLLDDGISYGKIGESYGVNKGVIYMFMNSDYIPANDVIKQRLGLIEGSEIIVIVRKRAKDGTFLKG